MAAADRRTEIVEIALSHFAASGYKGTSTDAIAAEAGISQPYLFRLFRTKRELFLACCAACHAAIKATFVDAAIDLPQPERFAAMGAAYRDLLEDRRLLLFQMQQYAACSDPVIQSWVRDGYLDLLDTVQSLTDAHAEDVWAFFGKGMLLNVIASLGLPSDALPAR
jgi:AcrR family transcriptional regulator